jgi:hypothetical protein
MPDSTRAYTARTHLSHFAGYRPLSQLFCLCSILLPLAFQSPRAETLSHVLQPALLDNKSYTEIYTLSALHDDQTFVQVQLTITNLGVENRNAAGKALVLHP